jgi:lysozyme family protein
MNMTRTQKHKITEWSFKAQQWARWSKRNGMGWETAEVTTPYGYAIIDLNHGVRTPYLRAWFIWKGREHNITMTRQKPFSRVGAVRIVNKWMCKIMEAR